ncbi:penicillin-binding protein 2, partial [Streptomyces sp. TRM76130]|nr:penicillin-binding protein 2 [Streptomyces sp. TRM76130]
GPAVRNIYDALYGVSDDGEIDTDKALLPTPQKSLPKIKTDGTIAAPKISDDPAKDQQATGTGESTVLDGTDQGATVANQDTGNRQTRRRRRGGCPGDRTRRTRRMLT